MLKLLVLLALNCVSCFIFRVFIHRGRMKIKINGRDKGDATILLSGFMSQPEGAFGCVPVVFVSSAQIFCNYSCFGWSVEESIEQINRLARESRYYSYRVYSIGVGDKVARSLKYCSRIYSINPCPNPSVLQRPYQITLPLVTVLLKTLSFLFGWLSVIPVFPTEDTFYSLALVADQLSEISLNRSTRPNNREITGIVYSSHDEYIDNGGVLFFYNQRTMPNVVINSYHARTSSSVESTTYNEALKKLKMQFEILED